MHRCAILFFEQEILQTLSTCLSIEKEGWPNRWCQISSWEKVFDLVEDGTCLDEQPRVVAHLVSLEILLIDVESLGWCELAVEGCT